MGLDFIVYKKRKDESCANAIRNEDNELAYGRKSWELVHFLVPMYEYAWMDYNEDPVVQEEVWAQLMEKMAPIGDKLKDVWEAYATINELDEVGPKEYRRFKKAFDLINEYEKWHGATFGESPTLGYDFSVGYMISMWEARDKVKEVFADPEMEVRACVSY